MEKTKGISFKVVLAIIIAVIVILAIIFVVAKNESIVKTYEITNNDMENYKAKKEYVPGKKNPFAPVDTSSDTDSTDDDASSVITTPGGNSNSSGSLFEKPGTK